VFKLLIAIAFLAMLVSAPADPAYAQTEIKTDFADLVCDEGVVIMATDKSEGILRILSNCSDPILVTETSKKGKVEDVGTVPPGANFVIFFTIDKGSTISVLSLGGVGTFDLSVDK
jgi:hypothetical protein